MDKENDFLIMGMALCLVMICVLISVLWIVNTGFQLSDLSNFQSQSQSQPAKDDCDTCQEVRKFRKLFEQTLDKDF